MEAPDRCILCGGARTRSVDASSHIRQCEECGLLFDSPRPAQPEIADYYSREGHYRDWLAEYAGRERLWRRRLRIVRRFSRDGGRLLDVGAGIGQFLNLARACYEVAGTELSREAIGIAQTKYGLELRLSTLDEVAREGRAYDVVTLFHVLEHLPWPGDALALCHHILRPGGIIVVAVPNESALNRPAIKRALNPILRGIGLRGFAVQPRFERIALDPGHTREIHLSHFTPSVLAHSLIRSGFALRHLSLDPYFTSLGYKLLYREIDYRLFSLLRLLTRHNLYETILAVGQRPATR